MDNRQWSAGAAITPPTPAASPVSGYPTSGNPATGTPPTPIDPYWGHAVGEEIREVIVAAGITPNYTALNQLALAIVALIQNSKQIDTVSVLNTAGSHTVSVPANCYFAIIEMWGAGAGGASASDADHGESGSSGAYCKKYLSVVPGDSLVFAIGAGGATYVASSGSAPAGGDSTLTINGTLTMTAGGAQGATIVGSSGGAPGIPGVAIGGDINLNGHYGADGIGPTVTGYDSYLPGASAPFGGAGGLQSYPSATAKNGQWPGGGGAASHTVQGIGADGGAIIVFRKTVTA